MRAVTDRDHLTDRLTALIAELPARAAGGAVGFLHRFLGPLASTLTVLVLTTYFMADLPRLQRGVVNLSRRGGATGPPGHPDRQRGRRLSRSTTPATPRK